MNTEVNHPNYSLTKSRKEEDTDEGYINPLPRAVIRPNSFLLLDGNWNFSLDPENRGINERWYISHQYNVQAHWPGSVENHMSKNYPNEKLWHDKVIVWYEREFPATKTF